MKVFELIEKMKQAAPLAIMLMPRTKLAPIFWKIGETKRDEKLRPMYTIAPRNAISL